MKGRAALAFTVPLGKHREGTDDDAAATATQTTALALAALASYIQETTFN